MIVLDAEKEARSQSVVSSWCRRRLRGIWGGEEDEKFNSVFTPKNKKNKRNNARKRQRIIKSVFFLHFAVLWLLPSTNVVEFLTNYCVLVLDVRGSDCARRCLSVRREEM